MLQKEEKDKIIEQFKINEHDTGSIEVQIALLTNKINELSQHTKTHAKDFSSKRGLLKMVNMRRKYLKHLAKTDEKKYKDIISRLGIRK